MGLAADKGGDWGQASEWLDKAVDGLRKAGQQHQIPCGLLARGAMYRHRGMWPQAWRDVDEVYEIAERGGMRRWLVDHALEAGRVCVAQGRKKRAREYYEKANIPPQQLEMMKLYSFPENSSWTIYFALWTAVFIGYLLYIRKYFNGVSPLNSEK